MSLVEMALKEEHAPQVQLILSTWLGGQWNFAFTRYFGLAKAAWMRLKPVKGFCKGQNSSSCVVLALDFIMPFRSNCTCRTAFDTFAAGSFGKEEAILVMILIRSLAGGNSCVNHH